MLYWLAGFTTAAVTQTVQGILLLLVFPEDGILLVRVWYFISISQTYNMYKTGCSYSRTDTTTTKAWWHVVALCLNSVSARQPPWTTLPIWHPFFFFFAVYDILSNPGVQGVDTISWTPVLCNGIQNSRGGIDSNIWPFCRVFVCDVGLNSFKKNIDMTGDSKLLNCRIYGAVLLKSQYSLLAGF